MGPARPSGAFASPRFGVDATCRSGDGAGECVPRLFPEAQGTGCEPVIGKMRALLETLMAIDRAVKSTDIG